ncbi:hypothetical protein FRC04_008588 [Tulasnella sp. 424]|nr:hypothetical protein FRC04_008588 [Tulasnella sp. 424]KAG8958867.1 hypothetical protein FRC05_008329 [Tulasnella sp. 425]
MQTSLPGSSTSSPGSSARSLLLASTPVAEHSGNVLDFLRKKCEEEESDAWWDEAPVEGPAATLLDAPSWAHPQHSPSSHQLAASPTSTLSPQQPTRRPLLPPTPTSVSPRPSASSAWAVTAASSLGSTHSGPNSQGTPRSNSFLSLLGQACPASHAFLPNGSSEPPAKRAKLAKESALPSFPRPQASSSTPSPLSSKLHPRAAAFFSMEDARAKKQRRDSQRAAAHFAQKDAVAKLVKATTTLSSQPRTGDYRGVAQFGKPRPPTRTIPAGPWPLLLPAAVVEWEEQRLFVWRSYSYRGAAEMDVKIQEAVHRLESTTTPELFPSHSQGNFTMRQFMVHRSCTKTPRNGSYLLKNISAAKVLAEDLADVVKLVNDIFKAQFPQLYAHYRECMIYVMQCTSLKDFPIYNLWGAFASLAVNAGGRVWTLNHTDSDNYFAGLCVVVGFGPYNFRRSAKLVIDLGNKSVEFELPPAVPLFLPSAIFTHYNTRIVGGDEQRGSLVFWTSGQLFQWVDLRGRCESDLSADELEEWVKGRQGRLRAAFGRFPIFRPSTSSAMPN